MNPYIDWSIFWSVLAAVAITLFVFNLDLRRHRNALIRQLRITLADYEDFLSGERYVKECDETATDKYEDPDDFFDAKASIRGLHFEYRQTFTGEDLSEQIAECKQAHERLHRKVEKSLLD